MKNYSLPAALILVLLSVSSGCGTIGNVYTYTGDGLLYTHRVEPLTFNPRPTGIVEHSSQGTRKIIQVQYVTVTWDDNALGDIAKKGGITSLYYADVETRSILLGLWSRSIVRLYGTTEEPARAAATAP